MSALRRAAPFVLAQGGWLAVAWLAGAGRTGPAALAGFAVAGAASLCAARPGRTALFAAGAALCGPLGDRALVAAGLLALRDLPAGGVLMPAWWCALWAMFCASAPSSLSFLAGRPWLGAVLGAAAGPPAYVAGAAFGALTLHAEAWRSLAALAALWAVLLPLCVHLGVRAAGGARTAAGTAAAGGAPPARAAREGGA